MATNGNHPITGTADQFGYSKREDIAIKLAAGMWANPAIYKFLLSRPITVEGIGNVIAQEAVKAADRLINALNGPLETVKQPEQQEDENEEDKPSDYPEEK